MTLWLRVSADEYELPEIVCDTVHELSEICKVSASCIQSSYSKFKHGINKTCRYRRVEIEEDDNDSMDGGNA